jgi:hypothetical protein
VRQLSYQQEIFFVNLVNKPWKTKMIDFFWKIKDDWFCSACRQPMLLAFCEIKFSQAHKHAELYVLAIYL